MILTFLLTTATEVVLLDGRVADLTTCLLPNGVEPEDGWRVIFLVDDQPYMSAVENPQDAIESIWQQVNDAGYNLSHESIGLSCNLYWMQGIPEEKHVVDLAELLLLGREIILGDVPEGHILYRPFRHPESWGSVYWLHLGHELAMDIWTYESFKVSVLKLQANLNSELNPSRGCERCLLHGETYFHAYLVKPHSLEESQRWLCDFHNSVNKTLDKPIISFEDASEIYGW